MTPGSRRSRRRGMMMGAAISKSRSNKAQAATLSAPSPDQSLTPDITKQLTDLKSLLDSGILTQDEFDAKKKQILGL